MTEKTKTRTRVLAAIAGHGTRNDHYLLQLVHEYHSMSHDVDIVVLSNIPKHVAARVEVFVVDLRGKNPWSLPFPHKRIFADRLNDYNLFIYSEDDTLIREKNLAVAPNMARLAAAWKSLRGDRSSAALGSYERTGANRVSRGIFQSWFRSVGMKIEKIVHLQRKSSTKIRRIASRVLESWMADEFVVVARKHPDSQAS